MSWTVVITGGAADSLRKMDAFNRKIILKWLKKNIEGCADPRLKGKPLTGDKRGFWRYRIGDYRVLCVIKDCELVVYAVEVGHRREVYRR